MCGFTAQLFEHHTGIAEVTSSNPRWSPDIFQASSFQLLKLENLLRWSLFTFIYNRSTNMNFTYISKHFIHSQWKALQSYGPYPCEFLTSQTQLFSNESSRCLSVYTTGWEITDMWLAMKDYGSISAKYETIPFGIKKKKNSTVSVGWDKHRLVIFQNSQTFTPASRLVIF